MSRTPRILALVAALALPVGAVVALLLADPEPPKQPPTVRIGESAGPAPSTVTSGPPPPPSTSTSSPAPPPRTVLPPPPPVDDDDDDDGGDDDG
ncbi:hypothetical protein [Amycolatopsis suaedae]|uniref:Small hydrophilic protein n=1 Tax=Amycolatopsis suaedae TaxID=2510978 RepID=A0A4Q7J1U0_9PSEU|nr:hypothetical protein [Amycolatopsis suaedae]RZQ60552.1 hypothetical protein EWH70_28160 [Amycolatopsis suaedae]